MLFIVGGGGGTNEPTAPPRPEATFGSTETGAFPNNVPIVAQISDYPAAVHGSADRNALDMISSERMTCSTCRPAGVVGASEEQ